jgi:tRNA A37 methylthiotransferase MiaB
VTPDPAEADVLLVNTCAFIEAAKRESIDAILEMADRLVMAEEPEISELLKKQLSRRMEVYTSVLAEGVKKSANGIAVIVNDTKNAQKKEFTAQKILETVVNDMEFKTLIGFPDPEDELLEPMKGPSVYLIEFMIGNPVFRRIEVVEIS